MRFTWDPNKERRNKRKHGVGFQEASAVFGDSTGEERLLTVGQSSTGRLLLVCHVEQGDTIRIISARRATAHERKDYET
jgi:uncharacterized DUF497 family protein